MQIRHQPPEIFSIAGLLKSMVFLFFSLKTSILVFGSQISESGEHFLLLLSKSSGRNLVFYSLPLTVI